MDERAWRVGRVWAVGALIAVGCGDDGGGPDDAGGSTTTAGATSTSTTTSTTSSGTDDGGSGGDTGQVGPPACGSGEYAWAGLIPGPGEAGFDAALESRVDAYERMHWATAALPTGLATELSVPPDDAPARAAIEAFAASTEWDFTAATGRDPLATIAAWHKPAGAFGGAAAAATAYRYGVLRDQGYPCDAVDRAREHVTATLEALHRAVALTGVPGVIVRGYAHVDYPGAGQDNTTVPLFDGDGNPLPIEKNNGTWRADNSGQLPQYIWEDSCSRDQLVGWVMGMAAAWEVIEDDPTFDDALKTQLQADAAAMARGLSEVRPSGFDLEIPDADGRTTFHGHLHENNIEGVYLGLLNGFHALMAVGIVGALASIADDAEIDAYLYDELIAERSLHEIARNNMLVDFGIQSNYSGYNMAFAAGWLAIRYVEGDQTRAVLHEAIANLYDRPGGTRQPAELGQTLFDVVYAASVGGGSAFADPSGPPDDDALNRGLVTARDFPAVPAWSFGLENCDAAEIASGVCIAADGTRLTIADELGRGDIVVSNEPVPMRTRPFSNYHWRTNPYGVNGTGDGSVLTSGADLRVAYWAARFVRR